MATTTAPTAMVRLGSYALLCFCVVSAASGSVVLSQRQSSESSPGIRCADQGLVARVVLGEPTCVKVLASGDPCAPLVMGISAVCDSSLVCKASDTCGKAVKGDICTDDPSACADDLSCRPFATSMTEHGPAPYGPVKVCVRANIPEGGFCSIGAIETKNVAPPGTWTPSPGQKTTVAQTPLLDLCMEGLLCRNGKCSSSSKSTAGLEGVSQKGNRKYVPIGSACDAVNAECPAINFSWMKGLKSAREVSSSCKQGICASTDVDYLVGNSCEIGCEDLACESGQCVDNSVDPWVAFSDQIGFSENDSSLPKDGESCPFGECGFKGDRKLVCLYGKTCVPESFGRGRDAKCSSENAEQQECATGLTCKHLQGQGLRCVAETLIPGARCIGLRPPSNAENETSQRCVPNATRHTDVFNGGRCLVTAKSGDRCGLMEGILCEAGLSCLLGTCV